MIDETLIQKLVDGELSNDQIRDILSDADQADQSRPETSAWKQLAVAFAENQMFQRAFSDLDSAVALNDDTPSTRQRPVRTFTESAHANSSLRTMLTFALAASLLIGVSILYQQYGATKHLNEANIVASNDPAAPEDQSTQLRLNFDHSTLLTLTPDRQLDSAQLPTSFSQKVDRQVPLFDAKRFDRRQLDGLRGNDTAARRAWVDQVMPNNGVTDQLVADYEKAGLRVDQDIEFLSGRLDDGRAYMIPYRTVRFSAGQ